MSADARSGGKTQRLGTRGPRYLTFLGGALVGSIGAWMLRTTQILLVIHLTNGDGSSVGLVSGAQYLPTLLLGALIGVQADRRPKAPLLVVAQLVMIGSGIAQGAILWSDHESTTTTGVLAVLFGVGVAVDGPLRTAVVPDLVPVPDIESAVGLNVVVLQLARLVGPMFAGLLIVTTSYATTFVVSTGMVALFLVAIPLATAGCAAAAPTNGNGGLRPGLAYLRHQPEIQVVLVLIGVGGLVGPNLFTIASLMIHDEFGGGPWEIAYASSALAVGAIAGSFGATRIRRRGAGATVALTATVGATTAVSALMPNVVSYLVVLALAGAAALGMVSRGTATVQGLVSPSMRGRVTGIYFVVLVAGAPVGAPVIGGLAEWIGIRAAVVAAGVLILACALTLGALARHRSIRPASPSRETPVRSLCTDGGAAERPASEEMAREL